MFQNLINQCEPLEGTDGGVLIQRSALWDEPGHGETIGAICDRFDKISPELSGEVFLTLNVKNRKEI